MRNAEVRLLLSLAVAAFYSFFVFKALKTGRLKKYWGGWITSAEAPVSFYASIIISALLAFFAIYMAVKSTLILTAK